ncbi:ABC transporter permease [Amycolatopsis sp. lyj-23]|uniref:ABC transporter permease n=1 Tax=Amycolatopsis sp. lyj-23 TaxID=2789283 RepID=UPI003978667A
MTTLSRPTALPRPGTLLAAALAVLLAVAALRPSWLTGAGPADVDPQAILRAPSAAHPFGTDQLGRDVLARVVHGAGYSLGTGLSATLLAVTGGCVFGLLAAFGGRAADQVVSRVVDVLLAFPGLLLALLVIAVLGPGPVTAVPAIGLASIPHYTRLVRGQALVAAHAGYVEAAVALGRPRLAVLLRHVLPNIAGPVLVLATLGTGTAIMIGSSLSFLGLGAQPPAPEWGAMLADGRDFAALAWWPAVFPGAAIAATVVTITVLGRRARDRSAGAPA